MSNDWFNFTSPLVRKTTARAEPLNTLFTAIQSFAGLLPRKAEVYEGRINFCGSDSGAVNAYVVTPPYAVTLSDGLRLVWRAGLTNTGPATLNAGGTGAIAITDGGGNALSGGEIILGADTETIYNLTNNQHRIANPRVTIGTLTVNNKTAVDSTDTPDYLENKILGVGVSVTKTGAVGSRKITLTVDEGQAALYAKLISGV